MNTTTDVLKVKNGDQVIPQDLSCPFSACHGLTFTEAGLYYHLFKHRKESVIAKLVGYVKTLRKLQGEKR